MPSSDYTGVGGGLKLKGVKAGGVDKKRKKKSKDASKRGESSTATATSTPKDNDDSGGKDGESAVTRALREEDLTGAGDEGQAAMGGRPPKTEAERRHEEMRRKRLDERLKREGVKTHKERVEELNRYLSSLSEHHDMPRIGPG